MSLETRYAADETVAAITANHRTKPDPDSRSRYFHPCRLENKV